MIDSKIIKNINGVDIVEYTLKTDLLEVAILNLGATVKRIKVNGTDVILGFNDPGLYLYSTAYLGATVGRTANRIGKAEFSIDGVTYHITKNEGNNNLHGGKEGFHRQMFDCKVVGEKLVCTYVSKDKEEGYPGNLTFTATYEAANNEFIMTYDATTDKDTAWAPTAHIYFNMDGENAGDATSNFIKINADKYSVVDKELIPTGEAKDVIGTVFDFRNGKNIDTDFDKINGYDHNFILCSNHCLTMIGNKSGIKMEMYSDMPGVQMYSGIASQGGIEGLSKKYYAREGIALEPQFVPNAINMDGYDKPILRKGETKSHYIKLAFSC